MAVTARGRQQQRRCYQLAYDTLQERLQDHDKKQRCLAKKRRTPATRVRICPSDPSAALGRDKFKVFRPLYNVQIVQDLDSPFVLGYGVYATNSDVGLLPGMLQRTRQLTGKMVKRVLSDGIYATLTSVRYCRDNGVQLYAPAGPGSAPSQSKGQGRRGAKAAKGQGEAQPGTAAEPERLGKEQFRWEQDKQTYRCPQGQLLQLESIKKEERGEGESVQVQIYRCAGEHCVKCPLQQRCTKSPEKGRTVQRMQGQELLDELAARMKTEAGKQEYKKRKQTVELRYADTKEHRGLVRARGYGVVQAWSQTGLVVLASNGLTLQREREKKKQKAKAEQKGKKGSAGTGAVRPDEQGGERGRESVEAEGADSPARQAKQPGRPTEAREPPRQPGTTRQKLAPPRPRQADADWFGWN
jgi:hypothetical protein